MLPLSIATHEQAQAQFSEIKGRMAEGTATLADKRQFKELRAYIYFNGQTPEHMRSKTMTLDPNSPYSSEESALAPMYEPAADASEYKLNPSMVVPETMDSGHIESIKQLCLDAKLPGDVGSMILNRFVRHANVQSDLLMDDGGKAELHKTASYFFKGEERFKEAAYKAENYLKSVLSPAAFADVEQHIFTTSLAYDPVILQKLSALHDARGMKLKS